MWGSQNMVSWSALSATSGLVHLLAAYFALEAVPYPIRWGLQSLALGALFFAWRGARAPSLRPPRRRTGAHALCRRDRRLRQPRRGAGARARVGFAVWSLEVAALAWIRRRLPLAALDTLAATLVPVSWCACSRVRLSSTIRSGAG